MYTRTLVLFRGCSLALKGEKKNRYYIYCTHRALCQAGKEVCPCGRVVVGYPAVRRYGKRTDGLVLNQSCLPVTEYKTNVIRCGNEYIANDIDQSSQKHDVCHEKKEKCNLTKIIYTLVNRFTCHPQFSFRQLAFYAHSETVRDAKYVPV